MGWNFAKTEDYTVSGANVQAFETFGVDGSIIREIIQNSLDAKRDECSHVKIEIIISKRKTSDFPDREKLLDTLKACRSVFEDSDTKSTRKIDKMITSISGFEHYVVTFKDLNTTGLLGGLDRMKDQKTNLFQLIYGDGTTNKNTEKSSGGSFGIGKNAPFTRSSIKSIFYDTFNTDNASHIVGKSILTSHQLDGDYRSPRGYYIDDGKIENYLSDLSMNEEYGTAVHIPFYTLINDSIHEELELLTRDILLNFIVAIHEGKLEVTFIDAVHDKELTINNVTYGEYITKKGQVEKEKKEYKKIRAMHNLLINENVHRHTLYPDESNTDNYIDLFVTLNKDSIGFKRYFNLREQLMLIEDKKIKGKNYKYDAMAIYYGKALNHVLRDAEPPEHNKWLIKNLETEQDKKYFRDVKNLVEEKIADLFSEVSNDEIILKEFNNSIFADEKEYEEVYHLKRIDDKSKVKSKGKSAELGTVDLHGTSRKVKNKDKSNDKSMISDLGLNEENVITHENVTTKIRSRGDGRYIMSLKDGYEPNEDNILVYSKTDTGTDELISNYKILSVNAAKIELQIEDVDLDIRIAIKEVYEAKK
ncbi:hypothetical protein RZE82_05110 [Mollicutes bacterium LVI A0039]|nr:hypothetical protein RZE82_05110 [Mollicutes bacterium LVI A0039]